MTATRNGVSAKELERQLGVTYKTAWRIGHELRKLMAGKNDIDPPMSGHVDVDETYVGEFSYRYNMRQNPAGMFDQLMASL